jgi:DNA polymerase/3'-5' exonuclease PolX
MTDEEPIQTAKRKYPRADAIAVARELTRGLECGCVRLKVAGSLRRMKREVGDVELVYVPRWIEEADPADLFGGGAKLRVNVVDRVLGELLKLGVIEKRLNKVGRTAWGEANKLAVHVASGIPVDFFAATEENWWNYLVCRTGGAESNTAICLAAIDKGWKWNPYGEGFSRPSGIGREVRAMRSEEEVFAFVGMEYLPPAERH